jgi:hypothetical protein
MKRYQQDTSGYLMWGRFSVRISAESPTNLALLSGIFSVPTGKYQITV